MSKPTLESLAKRVEALEIALKAQKPIGRAEGLAQGDRHVPRQRVHARRG